MRVLCLYKTLFWHKCWRSSGPTLEWPLHWSQLFGETLDFRSILLTLTTDGEGEWHGAVKDWVRRSPLNLQNSVVFGRTNYGQGQVEGTSCKLSLAHGFCITNGKQMMGTSYKSWLKVRMSTGVQLNENQCWENLPERKRAGCNKMSSVIRPPVLKAFVKSAYFIGTNWTLLPTITFTGSVRITLLLLVHECFH